MLGGNGKEYFFYKLKAVFGIENFLAFDPLGGDRNVVNFALVVLHELKIYFGVLSAIFDYGVGYKGGGGEHLKMNGGVLPVGHAFKLLGQIVYFGNYARHFFLKIFSVFGEHNVPSL